MEISCSKEDLIEVVMDHHRHFPNKVFLSVRLSKPIGCDERDLLEERLRNECSIAIAYYEYKNQRFIIRFKSPLVKGGISERLERLIFEGESKLSEREALSLREYAYRCDKILDDIENLKVKIHGLEDITDTFHHYTLPFLLCMRDALEYSIRYRLNNGKREPWIGRKEWCTKALEKCFVDMAPEGELDEDRFVRHELQRKKISDAIEQMALGENDDE